MVRVASFVFRDLLGRLEYIKLSWVELVGWMTMKWKSLIGHVPKVISSVNGWLVFLSSWKMHFIVFWRNFGLLARALWF